MYFYLPHIILKINLKKSKSFLKMDPLPKELSDLEICEKVFLAGDHGGFALKESLKSYLLSINQPFEDLGPHNTDRCDHPDYASKVCLEVLSNSRYKGILICGSGVGIAIAANKYKGIRCGLCYDYSSAISAKTRDYCNVIALGGKLIGTEVARLIVEVFLKSPIEKDTVYYERMKKIQEIEKKN